MTCPPGAVVLLLLKGWGETGKWCTVNFVGLELHLEASPLITAKQANANIFYILTWNTW